MPYDPRPNSRYQLTGLNSIPTDGDEKTKGQRSNGASVALPSVPPQSATAPGDAFDPIAFDRLSLPEKLHRAAHASMTWQMGLISSVDPATASDARVRSALNAAQSLILAKVRIDETQFRPELPDRSAEHLARWQRLKAETAARERALAGEAPSPRASAAPAVITVPSSGD